MVVGAVHAAEFGLLLVDKTLPRSLLQPALAALLEAVAVTDDEYTAQPCAPAACGGHDWHGEIGVDGIVGSRSGRRLGNHRPNQEPTSSVLREAHARPSRVLKYSLTARLIAGNDRVLTGVDEAPADWYRTTARVTTAGQSPPPPATNTTTH